MDLMTQPYVRNGSRDLAARRILRGPDIPFAEKVSLT